jgi:hypothetical protein
MINKTVGLIKFLMKKNLEFHLQKKIQHLDKKIMQIN